MSVDGGGAVQGARGVFVVLDGVDGCGKSTQAERLAGRLSAHTGCEALHLREPGSTFLGEALRALLLDPAAVIGAPSETLLFAAARRQLLEERIAPALAEGRSVVCERGNPSTFAYQAVAGGIGERRVLALLGDWCAEPAPDLELVLDLPVELALARRGAHRDRIEARGDRYLRNVADGYRRYVSLAPRARAVDGAPEPEAVGEALWAAVREVLDGRG